MLCNADMAGQSFPHMNNLNESCGFSEFSD